MNLNPEKIASITNKVSAELSSGGDITKIFDRLFAKDPEIFSDMIPTLKGIIMKNLRDRKEERKKGNLSGNFDWGNPDNAHLPYKDN